MTGDDESRPVKVGEASWPDAPEPAAAKPAPKASKPRKPRASKPRKPRKAKAPKASKATAADAFTWRDHARLNIKPSKAQKAG